MTYFQDGRSQSGLAAVETQTKAIRATLAPRGFSYSAYGITGTVAAALGLNAAVWTMRNDASSAKLVFLERLRLQFTTLTAFTVPVTAGRRLHLVRSNVGANPSGGVALVPIAKNSNHPDSECGTIGGGDMRIAATTALTVTGVTWDTNPIRGMGLVHVGAAGAHHEAVFEFNPSDSAPVLLQPGQLLGLVAGQAFDAGGTWSLGVNCDWNEAVGWDSTLSE